MCPLIRKSAILSQKAIKLLWHHLSSWSLVTFLPYFPIAFMSLIVITLKIHWKYLSAMEDRLSEQQQYEHIIFSFLMYKIFTYTPKQCFKKYEQFTPFLYLWVCLMKAVSPVTSDLCEYVLFFKFSLKLWVKIIQSLYIPWKCQRYLQGYMFVCNKNKLCTPFHTAAKVHHS